MKLVVRRVCELEDSEYRACYSLNLRADGFMRERLVRSRYKNGEDYALMLVDDDRLLSWALVFEYAESYGAYFYTRLSERGKGHGSKVAREVEKMFEYVQVWPSDKAGDSLFSKYDFTPDYRYWSY